MGASPLMSIGMRAMSASYAALQTTGHNIANANTDGYSRQSVQLNSSGGQFTGAGFFGKGVDIATVERAHSEFLTREAALTSSIAAADAARSEQLGKLEQVFPLGENGIGYAAQQVFNSFVDVSNKPIDASSRQSVLARVGEFAARTSTAGRQLDTIQEGVTAELKIGIEQVNMLAGRVGDLNQQIAKLKGAGHDANDLLDQRDAAIGQISQYIQVTTVGAADGTMNVFIGGGQKLVLGTETATLVGVRDPYDASKVQIGVDDGGSLRRLDPALLGGGSLGGLITFQNGDLVDARNRLGQIASAVAGALNRQQSLGLDGRQPAQPGGPLLDVGQPAALAAYSNTGTAAVTLAVTDASLLQASDYELVADPALPAGSWSLTRLSDGQQTTVTDGAVVDGFRISIAGTPGPRDKLLLQPVGTAARNTVRSLDDPRGVAAASPMAAALSAGGRGTAAGASISATSADATAPALKAVVTFTDDSGGYGWSLLDASNTVVRSGTGTWTPGQPIDSAAWTPATPAQRNDWTLMLTGTPAAGDRLDVVPTPVPGADNGNANAMIALRDAGVVGREVLSNGSVRPGLTVTDAYADALADVGVRVQSAKLSAQQSESIAKSAADAKAEKSGVNLDEEAARLIQFQQSYQAAAKMLQVAQSVFDTLLQAAGA